NGIGIEPASKLNDAQTQAIRQHKTELMVLLRGEPPPTAQELQPENPRRKKLKRVARPKAAVATDFVQKATLPEANPTSGQPTAPVQAVRKAEVAWTPPCPMCSLPPPGSPNCLRCKGRAELERARKARPKAAEDDIPNYPLCQRCW